ncbi:MAG: zinc dependent phospholipase C family protein [Magnetovibrio sp.]|nr:zinc dependent phospholipase C family protein [Magnetovibrio sp.]
MPGGYAHITIVNQMREFVDARDDIPINVKIASADYLNFCELGGVSPDYPYLDILNSDAASWADLMHYVDTGAMIRAGVQRISALKGAAQTKGLAWLLGYAAHVAADVTIHPIVELKVGPYHGNEKAHRVCEMHQDAYIYQRLGLSKVGLAEHLDKRNNGLRSCHYPGDENRIDAIVGELWHGMLEEVHAEAYGQNPPNIDSWHAKFGPIVDIIEEGSALPSFARHIAVNAGLTYPEPDEVKHEEYIDSLKTPEGPMTYDAIFDRARDNIAQVWGWIGQDVSANTLDKTAAIGNWNLDTGRDENDALVFWTALQDQEA